MEITAGQLRAARALLDLSQQELAAKIGLHINALIRWERGTSRPHARTNQRMLALLVEMSITLLPGDGVARASNMWKIHTYEGIGFLRDVFEDTVAHVGFRGEALVVSSNEDLVIRNDPEMMERYFEVFKKLQSRERVIVPTSNKRLLSASTLYRFLPTEQVGDISWLVYGDRFAMYNLQSRQSVIIECAAYAKTQRLHFETLWAKAKPVR